MKLGYIGVVKELERSVSMASSFEGLVDEVEGTVRVYDRDANISCLCQLDEINYIEWDGYPDIRNWEESEWFMIEVKGQPFTYFVDLKDMGDSLRLPVEYYCQQVRDGAIFQEGAEVFRSDN